MCAGFALLANVSANLLIHRVVEDPKLSHPVFIPLLSIAALYVLIVLGACAAIGFRHGSPVRRAARWTAVVALVGVPFAMLAPDWWLAALIGSLAVAHGIDQMVGFAVRHPGRPTGTSRPASLQRRAWAQRFLRGGLDAWS